MLYRNEAFRIVAAVRVTNHLFDALLARSDPTRRFAFLPAAAWEAKDRWYTYGHVLDVSARFAATLRDWGVRPGDRVAAQVEKSIEAVMLYLACLRAGAVFLPLNPAYTADEVRYFLGDAEPRVFVCDPVEAGALASAAKATGARLETMGVWREGDRDAGTIFAADPGPGTTFETVPRGPDDLAAILYTSGTTGRSKGAMLSHANLAHNAATLAEHWRFTASDVLLHALPIFHTHGLFVACNVTMIAGGSMVFLPRFSPEALIDHMDGATCLMGVPTFYTRLLSDERFARETAAHMRLFVSGSAPLLAETHAAFEARTGHRVLERYGMTETNMNTSNPYDGERRAGTVGLPLPGTELRIVDGERAAAEGEPGVIEVRGPNVFAGYWRDPEKTAEELRDGWFVTGDIGTRDADGYVTIVGRAKDLVISGGFNIYPKEIEEALDAQPGVTESAAFGVPHPDLGEAAVAVIVGAADPDTVLENVRGTLARYKQPRAIWRVDELPRNTMGKVQKNVLREAYNDMFL